ncbi:tRNA adenosine deaminase-associated protein [Actinopolymorpha rutila]|uniref:Putative tRNA adenosine deaminase-associated protein n=1 Tax=Actinopolymorpha rutila TaxID=446787 RepID=A0A852ZMF8_9ACTN|nr:putative tRNA adenosine deaminase-associated protein [Actinopolymorpha rutila]
MQIENSKEWCAVSYFAAAFARSGGEWVASETDLDDVETVEDVVDAVHQVESDDEIVLVFVEEENWFGVVRVEGDEEPRVYVSDGAETFRSPVGEALVSELAEEHRLAAVVAGDVGGEVPVPATDLDEDEDEPVELPSEPIGEAGLLDDLGIRAEDLNRLAEAIGTPPAAAVAFLAERLGFAEALEAVR